jgi:hypothetical protein
MSVSCGPLWTRGYTPRGHSRGGFGEPDLRVSDAERADVADRLSKHYADGRLDQVEFNERLDRAMRAKTRSDLGGLFDDLPVASGNDVAARQRRTRPRDHRLLFLVVVIAALSTVGHSWIRINPPWLVIALLAFVWVRYGRGHRRR